MQIASASFVQQVGLFDQEAGSLVAVALSEPTSNSGSPWYLEIAAVTPEGEHLIGAMYTAATLQPVVGGPFYNNRIVAVAMVPGAKSWIARLSNPTAGLTATVSLSSEKCCSGPAWQPLEGKPINRFDLGPC